MTISITAPGAANMTGEHTSVYGPTSITFHDGKAKVDRLPDGVRAYLLSAGYTVDGEQAEQEAEPERQDSREVTTVQVGSPARDGAVDPQPGDFLGPVNAGKADPHGPLVVSPGIHAEGERVVAAGPVSSDPEKQDANESRLAEKLLVDQEPVSQPSGADWKEGTGPLGLSDPLSYTPDDGEPGKGASREAWVEFARTKGAPESELAEKGTDGALTRDELRAAYGS